jgi:chromosome segregation ATPase
MAAMIRGVSQPEIQRQVRQQRADIDGLYELVERVDQKVDALDVKLERVDQKVDALDVELDRRFGEISGQLSEVLRQLGGR